VRERLEAKGLMRLRVMVQMYLPPVPHGRKHPQFINVEPAWIVYCRNAAAVAQLRASVATTMRGLNGVRLILPPEASPECAPENRGADANGRGDSRQWVSERRPTDAKL
jgi:hypothetical protein